MKKKPFKGTGIRFYARDHGPTVYAPGRARYPAVRPRGRNLNLYHDGPLNYQTISRIFKKVHTIGGHSPAKVRKHHIRMVEFWERKLHREASVAYTNKYSLHRIL